MERGADEADAEPRRRRGRGGNRAGAGRPHPRRGAPRRIDILTVARRPASARRRGLACALSGLLLAGAAAPALAAATAWSGNDESAIRLITAADGFGAGHPLEAGIEFRFGPGWHGYWRKPGDAGVAPVFDWSASANLAPPALAWPAPERLVIEGLQNNVYSGRIVLPVSLARLDASQPLRLRLAVNYAACSEICVPRKADLALDLPAGAPTIASVEAPLIAAGRARVPRDPETIGVRVLETTLTGSGEATVLNVRLRSDRAPLLRPDLFVEGAGSGSPPAPEISLSEGGAAATLRVALSGPPATGRPLLLTLVDGPRAAAFTATPSAPPATWFSPLVILASVMLGGLAAMGWAAMAGRRRDSRP